MGWDELYQEHLKTIFGVKTIDEFSDEEVESAFSVLLSVLPNEGKLYKYRSFETDKFKKYYDSLKNGYLWFPQADELNDDFDTVLRFNPVAEAENIRNCLVSNPQLCFKAIAKHSPDSVVIGYDERDHQSFREVVDCYDTDTGKMDRKKALRLLSKKGITTQKALQYLEQVDVFVVNYIQNNQKALDRVVDNFVHLNFSFRQDSYIYAMTETYESNPLWAFYANNNRGFCIEYDFYKACSLGVDKKKKLLTTCRVTYSDNVEEYSFVDILKFILTGKKDTKLLLRSNLEMFGQLTTKQYDWSFEKEWRIILANLKDKRIPIDLVSRIIIDERALDTEEAKDLIDLCQKRKWAILIRKTQYINVAHKYVPYEEWKRRR